MYLEQIVFQSNPITLWNHYMFKLWSVFRKTLTFVLHMINLQASLHIFTSIAMVVKLEFSVWSSIFIKFIFFQTGWVIQNGPLIIQAIVRFYLSLERHNLFCYNAVFFKWKFLQLYIVGSWIVKHYMNTFICIIMYWYSEVKFFKENT